MKSLTNNTTDNNAYAEAALLTTLRKSEWTGKTKATDLDRKIAAENDADAKSTKTDKFLVTNDEPLWRALRKAGRDLHSVWEQWSSPWQDGGTRMIASWTWSEFAARVEAKAEHFNECVEAFCADYENIIKRQAPRLGKLFNATDYPAPVDIRRKFGVTVDYMPVPTTDDFRIKLSKEQMDKVRESTQRAVESALVRAARDPWKRMHGLVEKVIGTLSQPDKIFRDSMVNNIRQLCEMMPALNVMKDKGLEEITDRTQKELVTLDTAAMRDPKWKQVGHAGYDRSLAAQANRAEAKTKAQSILDRMDELMV